MGIQKTVLKYEAQILNQLNLHYQGIKWCELGNQITHNNKIAKDEYLKKGVQHISIDINGKDGSLPINLDSPIPFVFANQFDVITNYGTIEHVNNQYQVFKNVHEMCKTNGIMIHLFPAKGHWPGHCRYYYTEELVNNLAESCHYKIIDFRILASGTHIAPYNLIATVLLKEENSSFPPAKEFKELNGLIDTGVLKQVGNYTKTEEGEIIDAIRKLPPIVKYLGRKIMKMKKYDRT